MRISTVAQSEKYFGHLSKVYGEYRFALAPNEQKPFKGFFQNSILKVVHYYVVRCWYFYVPQATAAYTAYKWGINENYLSSLKDPKEFENDV